VLFQDNNRDPGAGKQKRVNHAGGTAADNTDLSLHDLRHDPTLRVDGSAKTLASVATVDGGDETRASRRPASRNVTPTSIRKIDQSSGLNIVGGWFAPPRQQI
jgi:hypothetical protein